MTTHSIIQRLQDFVFYYPFFMSYLWMIGGDETGTYQRLIQYRYGTIAITPEEHRLRESLKPRKKRKKSAESAALPSQ